VNVTRLARFDDAISEALSGELIEIKPDRKGGPRAKQRGW
jgi:hypothetical protein